MSDFMQSVDDLLCQIKQKPSIYNSAMMAPLRQFCEYRDNHRSLFTGLIGEASSLHPVNGGEVTVEATLSYIAVIADCGDTDTFSQPILQVITAETSFHKSKFKVTYDKPQQHVKVTHVRLLDGDNNVMMGRLAINITDEGKKLKPGDFIQLHLYTELTHTLNEGGGILQSQWCTSSSFRLWDTSLFPRLTPSSNQSSATPLFCRGICRRPRNQLH